MDGLLLLQVLLMLLAALVRWSLYSLAESYILPPGLLAIHCHPALAPAV